MKVLHVIPSIAAVRGGPSTAVAIFERRLAEAGLDVVTVTTDDNGPGARLTPPFPAASGGATRHYFPRQTGFYAVSLPLVRWVEAHAAEFDIVHVHALFSHTSTAGALAARRIGVPYIIRPCGTLTQYGVAQKSLRKRLSLALFERRAIAGAARIHCTSEQERDEALALGVPMRPFVLPLGIEPIPAGDPRRFRARFPAIGTRPVVLFLSRVHEKKNLEAAIDMLPRLGDGPEAPVLVICGTGEAGYMASLRRRAEGLGLAERVVWAGFVEGDAKSDALAAADVFLLPSFSENFGIAVVEALLAGIPCVIGEGVGIAAEVERGGGGIAVRPGPDAIAAAVGRLIDAGGARTLGAAARRVGTERYSATAMARALIAEYEAILAETR